MFISEQQVGYCVQVHSVMNEMFSMFDAEADKHGVEKIKTIGTCRRMCFRYQHE